MNHKPKPYLLEWSLTSQQGLQTGNAVKWRKKYTFAPVNRLRDAAHTICNACGILPSKVTLQNNSCPQGGLTLKHQSTLSVCDVTPWSASLSLHTSVPAWTINDLPADRVVGLTGKFSQQFEDWLSQSCFDIVTLHAEMCCPWLSVNVQFFLRIKRPSAFSSISGPDSGCGVWLLLFVFTTGYSGCKRSSSVIISLF